MLQLVLYGLGTTIGAGIYALIGEIAASSGYMAPWSFLAAAGLALLTAFSFATLSKRYPQAAGIALYVEKGFGSTKLALVCGILAVVAGVTSSAALLNGFVGYAQEFIPLGRLVIILSSLTLIGAIACFGIFQSVTIAAIITVIEIGGLAWVISLSAMAVANTAVDLTVFIPSLSYPAWSAIMTGAVLAFYAYIGFEDMIEVAEEVKNVRTNLPRAIIITLLVSTALYLSLIIFALLATSPGYLATSSAPLTDLVRAVSNQNTQVISAIGMLAIINGALIQIIMAARILYGLASRAQLPAWLARINPRTQTPVIATVLTSMSVTGLAVIGTIAGLAEITSVIILGLFCAVNFSLWNLERRNLTKSLRTHFTVLTSFVGGLLCALLIIRQAFQWI